MEDRRMETPTWDSEGLALAGFAEALCASSTLEEVERTFLAGFGRLIDASIYGYDLVDPTTGSPSCIATANVSDAFVARYEREARDVDPVLAEAYETGKATYNRALMSAEEWEESAVFRRAYRLHGIRHVVEVPVEGSGRVIGNLHFATSDAEQDFGPVDIRLAEALAGLLGQTIARINSQDQIEQQRDEALAALELAGAAVVVSDPLAPGPRLNDAARRLLATVVDAEERLNALLVRPAGGGAFSRRVEVELAGSGAGVLHANSAPLRGQLVTILELHRGELGIAAAPLTVLTPREAEVAKLIVDGLADREIAGRLQLSHHTVSQHVKRIYRKLNVGSRVELTRLLLAARIPRIGE
jgi:DNA-binding CsgD family transcriptional regulator/GAF domain-containing protein